MSHVAVVSSEQGLEEMKRLLLLLLGCAVQVRVQLLEFHIAPFYIHKSYNDVIKNQTSFKKDLTDKINRIHSLEY